MRVITVNHGKPFGSYRWYTFYCPKCNEQVTREKIEGNQCGGCGVGIEWPE